MKRIFWTVTALLLSMSTVGLRAQTAYSSMEFMQYNPDAQSAGMGHTYLGGGRGMYLYGDPTSFGKASDRLYASYSMSVLPQSGEGHTFWNSLSAGYKFSPRWSIMAGFRTQTSPKVTVVDQTGMEVGAVRPNNFSLDLGATMAITEQWQGFVRGSYIHSYQGLNASGFGLSIGANYVSEAMLYSLPVDYSITAALTNFGWGMKYDVGKREVGLPAAMEVGGRMGVLVADDHEVSLTALMGCELRSSVSNRVFGGLGIEYEFMKYASLRAGYNYRANLNTFSIGLGGQYKFASVDLAYLMTKRSAFNQLRLGLNIAF